MILDLKNAGTSVILISHDEHSLQRMADRSLVLEYGKLKEVIYA
jgi:ABC-type ATPase involved in cell division